MSNSAFTPAVLTIPAAATTATGELNVISNPSAASLSTTGWTGVTAVGTNSPLNPTVTTAFSIANTAGAESSTSGGYVSFTMPSGLQNKKLKVEFYFTTPATDVYKVSVYKSGSRVTLTTDSSGSTTLPASTTGKFVAYFDTDTTANWTVNITRTSGSTGPIYVTNVIVGPGIQPQGAVIGEPQAYSPIVSNITNINTQFWWQRIGSNMRIWGGFNTTAAPGGTGNININLLGVLNLTADLTKIKDQIRPSVTTQDSGLGYAYASYYLDTSTSNPLGQVRLVAGSSTTVEITSTVGTAGIWSRGSNIPGTWGYFTNANLDNLFLDVTIPIAEWASSGTVQLAQNDVEWAYNTTAWGTDNTSSNFGYGPGGASITGSLSASLTQRVTFQTPIQVGDDLSVEISSDGKVWRRSDTFMDASGNPVINSYSTLATGNSSAGVYLKSVSSSTTQLDVVFMRYASLANDDSPVVDWQNGWKWRVRKSSAGAAVGFGIVQPGVSSGLVSASGLPGNTTGSAIAAGYVGEVLTATWTGQTITGAATTLGTISNVQPGIYIVMAKCDGNKGTSTRTVGIYGGTSTYIESGAGFGGVEYLEAQDTTVIQANFSTTIRVTAAGTFTFASQVITGTSNVTSARGCLILVRIA